MDELSKWENEYDYDSGEESYQDGEEGKKIADNEEVTKRMIYDAEMEIAGMERKMRHHHTREREKYQIEKMVKAERERVRKMRRDMHL